MNAHARSSMAALACTVMVVASLALAAPAMAQDASSAQTLRQQYDALLANYERVAASRGDKATRDRAHAGRVVMRSLTDQQLAAMFKDGPHP